MFARMRQAVLYVTLAGLPLLASCSGRGTILTVVVETQSLISPEELERTVTIPLEVTLAGIPGNTACRCSTTNGRVIAWLEFARGTEYLAARQAVIARLINADLPAITLPPTTNALASASGILIVSLDSDRLSPAEVGMLAETMRRPLRRIPRVENVLVATRGELRYEVSVSAEKLQARALNLSQIVAVLRKATPRGESLIDAPADELPGLVIAAHHGDTIRLVDIATVERRTVDPPIADWKNFERRLPQQGPGRDAVLAVVIRTGEDPRSTLAGIDEYLAEARKAFPPDVTIERKIVLASNSNAGAARAAELSPAHRRLVALPPALAVAVTMIERDLPPDLLAVPEISPNLGARLAIKPRPGAAAHLIGPNLETLGRQAAELRDRIATLPGAEVELFGTAIEPRTDFELDDKKLGEAALDAQVVHDALDAVGAGIHVGRVAGPIEDTSCELVVVYDEASRGDPLALQLFSTDGKNLTLGDVAKRTIAATPKLIYRENGSRNACIFWQFMTKPTADESARLKKLLHTFGQELPAGYRLISD
jgi:multidrug efflux pump subunit AcrB